MSGMGRWRACAALLCVSASCGTATGDVLVQGQVLRSGEPVVGVEVSVGREVVETDADGRFEVLTRRGEAARVRAVDGDEGVEAFLCMEPPIPEVDEDDEPVPGNAIVVETVSLDLPPRRSEGAARVSVRLEDVRPNEVLTPLWLAAAVDAADDAPGRLRTVQWTPEVRNDRTVTFEGTVDPASRWVFAVLATTNGELTSLVVVPGQDLAADDEVPIWVIMSDELLRSWPWDGRLPDGADAVRITQSIDVDGLLLELPTLEVEPASARDVPVLDLDNRSLDLAVSAVWNRNRTCASRDTGRWYRDLFPLVETVVGYNVPTLTDDVPADDPLRAETPAPLSAEFTTAPVGVSWSQVPTDTELLTVVMDDGVRRFTASGAAACASRSGGTSVLWPDEWPTPDRVDMEAEVQAGNGVVFARCAIDTTPNP